MISVGEPFPDFSLSDQDGQVVTRSTLLGKRAVLFFYPKDDTTGCTAEACGFRDAAAALDGIAVYGISPDSAKSHRKFIQKFNLNYPLLVDEDHALAEALGLWVEKKLYGRTYMGVERTTFLLDENGITTKVIQKVKPEQHVEEIRREIAKYTAGNA